MDEDVNVTDTMNAVNVTESKARNQRVKTDDFVHDVNIHNDCELDSVGDGDDQLRISHGAQVDYSVCFEGWIRYGAFKHGGLGTRVEVFFG